MERAKYPPGVIDRIIDEEISRIDAANMLAAADLERRKIEARSALRRKFDRLWTRLRGGTGSKNK